MRHCMGHFSWTDASHKQHNSSVIWSTLWCWIRKQIIIYREKRGSRVHQNRPTSQITQPITHKKTKNKWHAFTVKVEGTITAEEALRYTYKLIFKQDLKEIREWGLFTERKGLMQMGRYHFQILWTLPFQFLQEIFDETTRSQVKTLRGYLSELKILIPPFIHFDVLLKKRIIKKSWTNPLTQ